MTIERPMFPPQAESTSAFCVPPAIPQPATETLTSESAKPAQGLSRRMALAGLAMLPATAALPVAAAAAEPDPIFAAIEKHKEALRQMAAAAEEARRLMRVAEQKFGPWAKLPESNRKPFSDYLDEISPNGDHDTVIDGPAHYLGEVTWDLSQTVPTSLAGLLTLAAYAQEVIEHKESTFDENDLRSMLLSLAEAAGPRGVLS